jgi:hypothetical protein
LGSIIGGGSNNCICFSNCSFNGGGFKNCIWNGASYSGISGGSYNGIVHAPNANVAGGLFNRIFGIPSTSCSTQSNISGGGYNSIYQADHSSILSGCGNSIYGNCSSIIGGSGNTIPIGKCWVGIFGCNITSVTDNTFHTNCLVVQNMPVTCNPSTCAPPLGAITGTLYFVNVGGMCQVWVK